MFSFSKLAVLVGAISLVWFGYRLRERLDASRAARGPVPRRGDRKGPGSFWPQGWNGRGANGNDTAGPPGAVDTVQCPNCGAYVAKGTKCCEPFASARSR